jgi:ParB family chromosome partitioning protein
LGELAHCTSLIVNAVHATGHRIAEWGAHADILARELALDITAYWQPIPAGYLGRVSKKRILQAMREGASEKAAQDIVRMKKPAMVEAAEKARSAQI